MMGSREDADALAAMVVAEAGGSPLFVSELVRHLEFAPETGAEGLSLDDVIRP